MLKKLLQLVFLLFLLSCSNDSAKEKKYIVTSPEIAEIISLIEGTENIAAVTLECDYPLKLQDKIKIGTFSKIDIEKVLAINPNIVFTSDLEQGSIAKELSKLDIRTVSIYPKNIKEFLRSIKQIGEEINQVDRASFVADSLQMKISEIRYPSKESNPNVYVEIYGTPLMTVSDSSFIGQLIEIAGGNNIFKELPRDYCRINSEKILQADPEVIITTYPGVTAAQISKRKGWKNIPAIRNKRIYTTDDIDPDLILRASPRIITGIMKLKRVIHENNK